MKRLLYLFVFFTWTQTFAADGLKFVINPDAASPPLRYIYGDSLSYEVSLINTDTTLYSGILYAGFRPGDGSNEDSVALGNIQIAGSDTLPFTIKIPVKPQYFKTGPEVVVVWPIIAGSKGNDFIDFIFIDQVLGGIDGLSNIAEPLVKGDRINFGVYGENELKQVRIMDISGAMVYESAENTNEMILPVLAKGMYFAEVSSRGNKTTILRFIR
jgi:hypothetical protein